MNGDQQSQPRPSRATVLTMPPRGPQPSPTGRQVVPPGSDHVEPAEEPGYGHGV